MKSEERVYFHMGKESLFNCLLYVCVLGGGGGVGEITVKLQQL